MSEPETIELRRYPSRKLYNKNASSYVRLPEVAEMVRKGANVRVEDTETGEDVTRAVLLQIILEQEGHSTGLFEQSVAFIRSQQEQIASQMSGAIGPPWNVFDPAAMQEMQREYQKKLTTFWSGAMPGMNMPGMPGAAPKKAESDADELKALRARLEELEKKVGKK